MFGLNHCKTLGSFLMSTIETSSGQGSSSGSAVGDNKYRETRQIETQDQTLPSGILGDDDACVLLWGLKGTRFLVFHSNVRIDGDVATSRNSVIRLYRTWNKGIDRYLPFSRRSPAWHLDRCKFNCRGGRSLTTGILKVAVSCSFPNRRIFRKDVPYADGLPR